MCLEKQCGVGAMSFFSLESISVIVIKNNMEEMSVGGAVACIFQLVLVA